MSKANEPTWELVIDESYESMKRLKVPGGYLYNFITSCADDRECTAMCFVPEVDLTRYASHLRDAYNQGFKDGQSELRSNVENQTTNKG